MPTIEARLHLNPRRALNLLRDERRLRRAAKRMPKPVPWDWARPRLIPLLAGPYLGEEALVTVVGEPGCAVVFGVEIEGTHILVDRTVAQRWEVSDTQLHEVAQSNLDRRAASLSAANLTHGTLSGRIVRILESVPWSSSVLLAPEQLQKIFGDHDQIFAAPRRETLMSFSLETPPHVVTHLVIDYESRAPIPLMLDPFALVDGKLIWQEFEDDEAWITE
jgi:hypothetical protein